VPAPFIITIDTEGDNVWSRAQPLTTRNSVCFPKFQALAERYAFRPTWLVNWEMAHDAACVEFLRDVLKREVGEVGLHLHAWDTPPLEPLTEDDGRHHPYLIEYPEPLMHAKLERLMGYLEETFQRPLRSHRAGRWAFDGRLARWLREHGFTADCSVCPGVNWRTTKGDPNGAGGTDYRQAPHAPYFINENNILEPDESAAPDALLEVPMTIAVPQSRWSRALLEISSKRHHWLRPNRHNGVAMRQRVDETNRKHLMFMIHSSELMSGGSPTFPDEASIDSLNADLEALFAHAQTRGCPGRTLGEFAAEWRAATPPLVGEK